MACIHSIKCAADDGYRLNYLGYDYLAIKTLVNRGVLSAIGRQIGVGKESGPPPVLLLITDPQLFYVLLCVCILILTTTDIFEATNDNGDHLVIKLQRLGRPSFRQIKNKRDYLKQRKTVSWLYMSRLGALREYAFMHALYTHGFPTPIPVDCNRHCIVMSYVDASLLYVIPVSMSDLSLLDPRNVTAVSACCHVQSSCS